MQGERIGEVQPLGKGAERDAHVFPRAGVDLAYLGGKLHLQGAQAVDVPVGDERGVRAAGGHGVGESGGDDRLCAADAALGDVADEHGVEILRDEGNFQRGKPLREHGGKFFGAKTRAAEQVFRLVEHAVKTFEPVRKIFAFGEQAAIRQTICNVLLRFSALEIFQQRAHEAAIFSAAHRRRRPLECGNEPLALCQQHERILHVFALCFIGGLQGRFLDRPQRAAAVIRILGKIIAEAFARCAVAAEKFAADERVSIGGIEPLGKQRKPAGDERRERMRRRAALFIGKIRDVVLGERFFQRHRIIGDVG